jgi:hypothetical protein
VQPSHVHCRGRLIRFRYGCRAVADASRCPECRAKVHPFAATCPSCGADLDAHRLRPGGSWRRTLRPRVPSVGSDVVDLLVLTAIMLLLALFAPLYGALFALFIVWHSHRNSAIGRRNAAVVCAALAVLNLFAPSLIEARLI